MKPKTYKAKSPVHLRAKQLKNGNVSLYLDIYVNGRRNYEYLNLYIVPERTRFDKQRNDTTRIQAEAAAAKRVIEIQNGTYGAVFSARNRMSVCEWLEQYAEKWSTSVHIANRAKQLITVLREFGDTRILAVDDNYLRRFIKYLNEREYIKNTNNHNAVKCAETCKYKPQTIFNYIAIFETALNCAVRKKIINNNPFSTLEKEEKPKPAKSKPKFLTADEVQKLIDTPTNHGTTKRAFLFSCFLGLRFSDIQRLTWENIIITQTGAEINLRQKKTGNDVSIPISENAQKWLPQRPTTAKNTDKVFLKLRDLANVNRHLKQWTKDAGINKNITFHVSRHTCATLLITYGADLYTTSKILGHASIQSTQVYARVIDEKKRAAVDMIPKFDK